MMLMILLAIVVNPLRDRTLWVGPSTDARIEIHSQKRSGMKTSTCLEEPFFTL